MDRTPRNLVRWLFASESGPRNRFVPRWFFLRCLAAIYFSAFLALVFQTRGLIGPDGILPAGQFLDSIANAGLIRFWYVPSLFWISSTSWWMMAVVWIGLAASVAAFFNLWPRLSFFLCFVCFLSWIAAATTFSEYQSDGMLLEAGFLALFFAPRGFWPGLGADSPPPRAPLFLLLWEWFRIYFESGLVKLLSGDPEWRHLTAMDHYYQNGPLPTWVGYYIQQLPHWFHVGTAGATLVMELAIVWMLFLPRRFRLILFFIVTPWEIGVILTANYAFLNYLVLFLGFLLLDDRSVRWLIPRRFRSSLDAAAASAPAEPQPRVEPVLSILATTESPAAPGAPPLPSQSLGRQGGRLRAHFRAFKLAAVAVLMLWIAYDTTAEMILIPWRDFPLFTTPIEALQPFRIANEYGLFAVMTRGRYEIEFQGSNDGQTWTSYRFCFKPQALDQAPGIYAPYQPRFDWNLWFASLGDWQSEQGRIVFITEGQLLLGDPAVLSIFCGNPFPDQPPKYIRAVLWQYWFTTLQEKHATGNWWRRAYAGLYGPEITLAPDGRIGVIQLPEPLPPQHD
jgi:lipase maturation factor 1